MRDEDMIETVRKKFERLTGVLDERGRRVWAAVEAEALGYGGQSIVAKATGLSRTTLHSEGLEKAQDPPANHRIRIRKAGGGRKKLTQQEPKLLSALEALVEPTTRGDPESALRWTCRSTRQLAAALKSQGYRIGHQTVASLLDDLGYSLQGNQKTTEGSSTQSVLFCRITTPI
jgi:Rhodopirellula transposase DDE domain